MLRTDEVIPQREAVHYDWEHDVTGVKFTNACIVKGVYPQFANHWFDSDQGGHQVSFKDDNGVEHKVETEDGVRCMMCLGVIAFDSEGKGVNYL